MESVGIGVLFVALLAFMFMPGARGVAAGIDSVENPSRQETEQERQQGNSDILRLLIGLAITFGLLFVMQAGG